MNEEQRTPDGQDEPSSDRAQESSPLPPVEPSPGHTPKPAPPPAPQPPKGQAADPSSGQLTTPLSFNDTMPVAGYPPPLGSPFVHMPPSGVEPTLAMTPDAYAPAPASPGLRAGNETSSGPSGGNGRSGFGAGAISAMVAAAIVLALVAGLLGGIAGAFFMSRRDVQVAVLPVAPAGSTERPAGSIAAVAARALPSVVTIKVKGADAAGTGSGFVLRADGYILTNNHVVDPAAKSGKITVLFSDGKRSGATIVGRDESYDLAVIRVDRTSLPVLGFGASSRVVVGDPVIAVGAPLGLDSTVTSGIVSALNRPVTPGGSGDSTSSINAIQTDAAINPGNSGGPLLDMSGRVIGVNSAIARVAGAESPVGGQSGNIGVGFAIPSDQARKTAEQLIATGKATHPVIGVMLDTAFEGEGVKIASAAKNGNPPISKGGPADKAGLKAGDIIIEFGGKPVTDPDEFVVAIRARSVGDEVELTVRRGSTERTVKITLQAAS